MMRLFSYLPNNWVAKNLPDVFFFQEGPGVRKWQFREKGIKLLNGSNINNGILDLSNTKIYIEETEANGKYKHFLVDEGDLVIASSGVVVDNFHNKIAFVKKEHLPLCMNTSTIRFQVLDDKQASLEFLKYFLKTKLFKIQIGRLITGSAQLNFGPSHLQKIQVPLPPLDDQIRIATVLTQAEKLIAKRKESIKALDELLKSTFLTMFGDPVRNEKGFQIKKLVIFIKHLTSGGRGWAKYYSKTGIRFIRSLDVKMNSIQNEDIVFVTPPKNQEAERTRVKPGDVLLTITGSKIGRVSFVPNGFEEAYISQHVAIIRTTKINPVYLSFYLSMPNAGQRLIKKEQYGQAKPGLNLSQIRNFLILIPPSELQTKFSLFVDKVEFLKAKYNRSLTEMENLYGSLSQRAFKGELDLSRVPVEKEKQIVDPSGRSKRSIIYDCRTIRIERTISIKKIFRRRVNKNHPISGRENFQL